jgi:tetratricopeptide (TPR) repeat protein
MKSSLPLLVSLLALQVSAADLSEARRLMNAKRVPEALPILEQAQAEAPENVELLLLLSRAQAETQQVPKALETLEKALKLAPARPDVLTAYGLANLAEAGKQRSLSLAKKGREALEKAIEAQPENTSARQALFTYYLNAPWIAGGSTDKARQQAEAINGYNPQIGLMLLVAVSNKDKKYEKSFALCDQALAKDAGDYFALYEFGRTATLSKTRLDEGLAALENCLGKTAPRDAAPHSMVYFRLGQIYAAKGDKDSARKQYEEGLKLDPSNKQISRALAELPGS